jgi:hypothetical protein
MEGRLAVPSISSLVSSSPLLDEQDYRQLMER